MPVTTRRSRADSERRHSSSTFTWSGPSWKRSGFPETEWTTASVARGTASSPARRQASATWASGSWARSS
jgi:hypothetical protein